MFRRPHLEDTMRGLNPIHVPHFQHFSVHNALVSARDKLRAHSIEITITLVALVGLLIGHLISEFQLCNHRLNSESPIIGQRLAEYACFCVVAAGIPHHARLERSALVPQRAVVSLSNCAFPRGSRNLECDEGLHLPGTLE